MSKGISKTLAAVAKARSRVGTLNEARYTITRLRRQNEVLAAKVEVIDTFTAITKSMNWGGGMGCTDVVEELDAMIKEEQSKQLPKPTS